MTDDLEDLACCFARLMGIGIPRVLEIATKSYNMWPTTEHGGLEKTSGTGKDKIVWKRWMCTLSLGASVCTCHVYVAVVYELLSA
jgi:hypothetical protein